MKQWEKVEIISGDKSLSRALPFSIRFKITATACRQACLGRNTNTFIIVLKQALFSRRREERWKSENNNHENVLRK